MYIIKYETSSGVHYDAGDGLTHRKKDARLFENRYRAWCHFAMKVTLGLMVPVSTFKILEV